MGVLNDERRQHFEALLRKRASELDADIRRENEKFDSRAQVAGEVPDAGDASVADLQQTLDQAEIGRDVAELRAVHGALGRLETGDYGQCVDCDVVIEDARLQAQPTAERCFECQTRYEQTHAGQRHATL